ncbi:Oligopeptide transport ATP-binding protein OppF [Roseobacter fucihabitans]|uniref:Oligopeptide transport ATP-binding protein OppF n=1 Tax=Roseobacter fucihabitans TaxID=1537242 RepID=A0ABZ2BQU2_9RHOB|nr:oligopeptide/dipeptide ABC transporter ATP-binding protein [Roseobacter litoralis]MBC6968215.1 Oligopeptide transport ATP-binding protein OppF [Roseobacter litoralis]
MTDAPLLRIKGLSAYYPIKSGVMRRQTGWVKAVEDVTFDIRASETLGLVGESGCGKTTLSRAILGLRDTQAGQIIFDGEDLTGKTAAELVERRRDMQLVFQDPYASLDPKKRVGATVRAGLDIHRIGTRAERDAKVAQIFSRVGLDPSLTNRFSHEFSGGQRQRIGIARALVMKPRFVICDEPVSALDVSIQSQVLNLLKDLQQDLNLTYLFVAHNLSVVEHMVDRVAVMYLGRLVELADRDDLFNAPRHPYTRALIDAIPAVSPRQRRERTLLSGDIPSPSNLPPGCPFQTRCPKVMDKCRAQMPPQRATPDNHMVACWLPEANTDTTIPEDGGDEGARHT